MRPFSVLRLRTAAAAVALLALAIAHPSPHAAEACSSSSERVAEATKHPDLPVDRYLQGRLGILRPTFARSYLVVAHRYLSGNTLSAEARTSAAQLLAARLNTVDAAQITQVPPEDLDAMPLWDKERTRVLGAKGAAVNASVYKNYASYTSCGADAFRTAADTLKAREKVYTRPELERWVQAQDAVFQACDKPTAPAPAALTASDSSLARADRDYQIAATALYADRFADAEARFRGIGKEKTSPWQRMARYLVVRALARKATLSLPDGIDKTGLRAALKEADALLADADMAPMHPALGRYRSWLRAKVDGSGALADTVTELGKVDQGPRFGQLLADYTLLVDSDEKVLDAPKDELTRWVASMQGKGTFDDALAQYTKTQAVPWLVATLVRAENVRDTRLEPALAAALALPQGSPALETARFHFLRISLGRGVPKASLASAVEGTLTQLPKDVGPSTRNAFELLAARVSPSFEGFLKHAVMTPAGESTDDGPVVFDAKLKAALPPSATEILSADVPLANWIAACESKVLPDAVRSHVADAAWVRAMLLGDEKAAKRAGAVAGKLNTKLKPYIERVESAASADERRLGLLHALLKVPTLGPAADAWSVGPDGEAPIDTSYGGYLWCAPSKDKREPSTVGSAADRAAAAKEAKALAALGAGPTWVANEAARLTKALKSDPRTPEVLHLAVRVTRYGCTDDRTRAASKAAFQALHAHYPQSDWAKKTPYYY